MDFSIQKELLDALYQSYQIDFRDYHAVFVNRRIKKMMAKYHESDSKVFASKILADDILREEFVFSLSIQVTEMFRDPDFFLYLRKNVIPELAQKDTIRVWCAGVSTGEEAYSLAIMFCEENLLDRVQILATDMNIIALKDARLSLYSQTKFLGFSEKYHASGGKYTLEKYFNYSNCSWSVSNEIRSKIIFLQHNLTEYSFNIFQLILCRNVLIFFNQNLQNQVIDSLNNSLELSGFLCLGTHETLMFSDVYKYYTPLSRKMKIYKKVLQ